MRVGRLIQSNSSPERIQQFHDYASWLLKIGNGTAPTIHENIIEVPSSMKCENPEDLKDSVYDDFDQHYNDVAYLRGRAILLPTNDVIQYYNYKMIDKMPEKNRNK